MRKLFTAFYLLTLLTFKLSAQWQIVNQGYNIQSFQFIDDKIGFALDFSSRLLKTTDAGNTWEIFDMNKDWAIYKLIFISESVGWGIGTTSESGIIFKTTDGGRNWTEQSFSNTWFNDITVKVNYIYALAGDKLISSSDYGKTWKIIFNQTEPLKYYNSVWFSSPDAGIILGQYYDNNKMVGIISRTTDGGNSWTEKLHPDYSFNNFYSVNDSVAFITGREDTLNCLYRTTDRGETWIVQSKTNYRIDNLCFLDVNKGYALNNENSRINIIKTTNGGINWVKIPSPDMGDWMSYNTVQFTKEGNGYLVGNSGFFFRTEDEKHWELLQNSYPLQGAIFLENKSILYGGYYAGTHQAYPYGDMFLSTDGCKTITPLFRAYDVFKRCRIIRDSVLIACGRSIHKSTNGGKDWSIKYTNAAELGFDSYINSINDFVFSTSSGLAVGRDYDKDLKKGKAVILQSSDAGENWSLEWQGWDSQDQRYYLTSISNTGTDTWAVGYPGLILKYSNSSSQGWKTVPSFTTLPLKKVFSIGTNVWISGGYSYEQSIFIKSTDNGTVWEKNTYLPYVLNDMFFKDKNIGWAVGFDSTYRGVLLKTKNGGESWEVIMSGLSGRLNSIQVEGKSAWAFGDNGLILKTDDLLTSVGDGDQIPSQYKLEQNYPNPFNPSTNISWHLAEESNVKIKIYDIIGREIALLVNEKQKAGIHQIEFNGSNLSSGIYFCKLETGAYSASIKMLLIK